MFVFIGTMTTGSRVGKTLSSEVLPGHLMDDRFGSIYRRNVTCAHEAWGVIALGLRNSYPEEQVCVKGNCAETTRCYFHPHREPRKINAETLAYVAHMTGNRYAIGQFDFWLEDARVVEEFSYNTLDIFHWEQKMGNWQAMSQLEWDIAQEVFTPFNCRELLTLLLSVDQEFRKPPDHTLHMRIIETLWGEILREPINPTSSAPSHRYLGIRTPLHPLRLCSAPSPY